MRYKLLIFSTLFLMMANVSCAESETGFPSTVADGHETIKDGDQTVATGLIAYQEGKVAGDDLDITYTDLHPLHGGLRLTIKGTGAVEQEAVRMDVGEAHDLSQDDVKNLVELLLELEAWQQEVPERTPQPDESRAYLQIQAGSGESETWEWYNDMEENGRLIRILEMMKQLAWSESE